MEVTYLPVPEVIAASVCWLSRWNARPSIVDEGVGFWHPSQCKFCSVELEDLLKMADLNRCEPGAIKRWEALSRKARAARVYEAQGDSWWETI
jgi:hypothetical protein